MRFSTWLFEQLEDVGPFSKIAKICWDDVNNGCGVATFTASQWADHFILKHPVKSHILVEMLFTANDEFTTYRRKLDA